MRPLPLSIVLGAAALLLAAAMWPVAAIDLARILQPPGPGGLLGTDELGRSLLSRLLNGAAFSLGLMVCAASGAVALGATLGGLAGWCGGWPDRAVQLLLNLFWSLPVAVFAVLVLAVAGPSFASLTLTIVAVNWVGSARIVRSAVVRLRQATFVKAAQARGVTPRRLLFEEIGPNLGPMLLLLLGFCAAEALTLEGSLALLGLSRPPPDPSWGAMVVSGLPYVASAPWVALAPAGVVVLAVGGARWLSGRIDAALLR